MSASADGVAPAGADSTTPATAVTARPVNPASAARAAVRREVAGTRGHSFHGGAGHRIFPRQPPTEKNPRQTTGNPTAAVRSAPMWRAVAIVALVAGAVGLGGMGRA